MPGRFTRRSNQILKLTDYHISRYVASTFKSLTKCATHRDLNQFQLFRRGITSTQPHPYLWQKIQLKTVTTLSMVRRLKLVYEYIPQFVQIDFYSFAAQNFTVTSTIDNLFTVIFPGFNGA